MSWGHLAKSQIHGRCSVTLDLPVRSVTSPAPSLFSAPGSPGHKPTPSAPCLLRSPSSPSRSASALLHPAPLPRTPPSPGCLPLPPSRDSRLTTLFPRSRPQISTPPGPSRTDFAGPGIACSGSGEEGGQRGQEPGSAGHGGQRLGQHAGTLAVAGWRWALRPSPAPHWLFRLPASLVAASHWTISLPSPAGGPH